MTDFCNWANIEISFNQTWLFNIIAMTFLVRRSCSRVLFWIEKKFAKLKVKHLPLSFFICKNCRSRPATLTKEINSIVDLSICILKIFSSTAFLQNTYLSVLLTGATIGPKDHSKSSKFST